MLQFAQKSCQISRKMQDLNLKKVIFYIRRPKENKATANLLLP